MLCLNVSDISIIIVKGVDYRCIIHDNLKQLIYFKKLCLIIVHVYKIHTKKINIKNHVLYHYENLVEPKKLETRNSLINQKSWKFFFLKKNS